MFALSEHPASRCVAVSPLQFAFVKFSSCRFVFLPNRFRSGMDARQIVAWFYRAMRTLFFGCVPGWRLFLPFVHSQVGVAGFTVVRFSFCDALQLGLVRSVMKSLFLAFCDSDTQGMAKRLCAKVQKAVNNFF